MTAPADTGAAAETGAEDETRLALGSIAESVGASTPAEAIADTLGDRST